MCQLQQRQNGPNIVTDENLSSARVIVEDDSLQSSTTNSQSQPLQTLMTSSSVANQQAPAVASATSHLSAQYSQFLASVRDFKPLVADLNTSIASVATSVTTMGADVISRHDAEAGITDSQQYASDVTLHSPIADPLQRDSSHHSLTGHRDGISQNQGNIDMCFLYYL